MTAIDLEVARQRIVSALPTRVRWNIDGIVVDSDFSRSQSPLQPLSASEIHGEVEKEWETLYLFGTQDYAEGGGAAPFIGVDAFSGEVCGLDVERDNSCMFLLNSSVDAYVETFLLFDRVLRSQTSTLDSLESGAAKIDPEGFKNGEWPMLIDYLLGA